MFTGPILQDEAFLGNVVDIVQMSIDRLLADQKRMSFLTLDTITAGHFSAEHFGIFA